MHTLVCKARFWIVCTVDDNSTGANFAIFIFSEKSVAPKTDEPVAMSPTRSTSTDKATGNLSLLYRVIIIFAVLL